MGNDYFNDGSYDNPYKTLKQAVLKSVSGNIIYVMSGYYTLGWNSNIQISKNITISGLGNVTFARPNDRNIFIVDTKGCLSIENIIFTLATTDGYTNPLIELSRGNLNVKNCNFYDIRSQAVIIAKNNEYINLDNVSFCRIKGPAILGFASNLNVKNSRFSKGSILRLPLINYGVNTANARTSAAPYLTFYITISATINVTNTTFIDNTAGAIGYYTHSVSYDFWNIDSSYINKLKTYIYNSTFENNQWDMDNIKVLDIGLAIGNYTMYHDYGYHMHGYGLVENSTFVNNTGHFMYASEINNSKFINNSALPY